MQEHACLNGVAVADCDPTPTAPITSDTVGRSVLAPAVVLIHEETRPPANYTGSPARTRHACLRCDSQFSQRIEMAGSMPQQAHQ